jgi:DNA-binding HxlR family transcriptional regulator
VPLQNRVTPFGDIVIDPCGGSLMGNRGILHDGNQRLGGSRWKHKNWVTCTLSFKGTKRPLMAAGKYTELFFLDEATALAAGHRPNALWRIAGRLGSISNKSLSAALRHLERNGLVGRKVFAQIPPRVDYWLTPLGDELASDIAALMKVLAHRNLTISEARRAYGER